MNILIAGGSGFVGTSLAKFLKEKGHHLTLLTRQNQVENSSYDRIISWVDLSTLTPNLFNVIVNLCGYGISEKRWSAKVKQKIIQSRIEPTQQLIEFIGSSEIKLINASAIGFYPFSSQKQTELDYLKAESNDISFSKQIVEQWEAVIRNANLKSFHILRFGVVLGKGGMLSKLLPSIKFGFGAKIGNGQQLISWVHINDLSKVIETLISNQLDDQNIINVVAPEPVKQQDLINYLSYLMHRPRFLWLPGFVVKLMFGQMGQELLLSSQNIFPEVLMENNFKFQYAHYKQALNNIVRS